MAGPEPGTSRDLDQLKGGALSGKRRALTAPAGAGYVSSGREDYLVQAMTNTGSGNLTASPNAWDTGLSPIAMVRGKFHGPSGVDDVVVLDSQPPALNILLNATIPKD